MKHRLSAFHLEYSPIHRQYMITASDDQAASQQLSSHVQITILTRERLYTYFQVVV